MGVAGYLLLSLIGLIGVLAVVLLNKVRRYTVIISDQRVIAERWVARPFFAGLRRTDEVHSWYYTEVANFRVTPPEPILRRRILQFDSLEGPVEFRLSGASRDDVATLIAMARTPGAASSPSHD